MKCEIGNCRRCHWCQNEAEYKSYMVTYTLDGASLAPCSPTTISSCSAHLPFLEITKKVKPQEGHSKPDRCTCNTYANDKWDFFRAVNDSNDSEPTEDKPTSPHSDNSNSHKHHIDVHMKPRSDKEEDDVEQMFQQVTGGKVSFVSTPSNEDSDGEK